MKKIFLAIAFALLGNYFVYAQDLLTPEMLWKLNRVSGLGISKDKKYVVYNVSTPNIEVNKSSSKKYYVSITGGKSNPILNAN